MTDVFSMWGAEDIGMSYGSYQAILTKGFSLRTALVKWIPQVLIRSRSIILAIQLDQGSSSQTMKQLEF